MTDESQAAFRERGEALFRLMVETVTEYAIFTMDTEGRVNSWNAGARRILGFDEKEVLGKPLDQIFTPEDIAMDVPGRELETAREIGRSEDERWHVRKDGSRFWALGIVTPLKGDDGALLGYGKILRDRTDLKELQDLLRGRAEALLEADERKNVFIATLAHELRNPLAPLANVAELLRRRAGGDKSLTAMSDMVDRQVRQLKRLVDDLLDIARISTGKLVLRKEPLILRSLVESSVEMALPLLEARQHELTISMPREEVWLKGDRDRLMQVMVNLLNNAAKYTEPGGRITVSCSVEDAEVVIRVRDNGIGISPEQMKDVFNLFSQSEVSLRQPGSGLGIGLSLVRDLVALHGGSVQGISEGLGKGSEFIVRLPIE